MCDTFGERKYNATHNCLYYHEDDNIFLSTRILHTRFVYVCMHVCVDVYPCGHVRGKNVYVCEGDMYTTSYSFHKSISCVFYY